MSATQKETFSPQNLTVFGGLLLLSVFIGEVVFSQKVDESAVVVKVDTVEEVAVRLAPVMNLGEMRESMAAVSQSISTIAQTPAQLYQSACLACHTTGAAGAPMIGNAAVWSVRASKGLEALVSSAVNGIGAMPARGGSQLSDDQIFSVVEYILDQSK